jgi:hypothetical protein
MSKQIIPNPEQKRKRSSFCRTCGADLAPCADNDVLRQFFCSALCTAPAALWAAQHSYGSADYHKRHHLDRQIRHRNVEAEVGNYAKVKLRAKR